MRDRVIVQIEAYIRLFADLHGQLQFTRVRVVRQREQAGLLADEGLTHGDRGLLPAGAIGCWPRAPECGLGVQIIKVSEFARGKERVAYKPDGTLDAPLLVVMGSSP
jgi:hypothetical protein